MKLNYPFEFKELLITDKVLDALGFSEYWAGSGDFGERSFGVEGVRLFRIVEIDEIDDPDAGYGYGEPEYCARHYGEPFSSRNSLKNIYFLHELYESVLANCPGLMDMFVEKTKGVNMYPYIKSWVEFKENYGKNV